MISSPTQIRRPENLALIFQELLTAIVRLRSGRPTVSDPDAFRHYTREALKTAARQALAIGYSGDAVKQATFAVVAFLDESVRNSKNPIFAGWLKKPLQEELFGTHVAGDVFFQNIQQLLVRTDSVELADLLEVHCLCLLLGFGGRYSASQGELKQVKDSVTEKISRTRGPLKLLAPAAIIPQETVKSAKNLGRRRLAVAAILGFAVNSGRSQVSFHLI